MESDGATVLPEGLTLEGLFSQNVPVSVSVSVPVPVSEGEKLFPRPYIKSTVGL